MALSILSPIALTVLMIFAAARIGRLAWKARSLSSAQQADFERRWYAVERNFVSTPKPALHAARQLLSRLLQARGVRLERAEPKVGVRLLGRQRARARRYRDLFALEEVALAGNLGMDALREVLIQHRIAFEELLGADLQEPPPRPGAFAQYRTRSQGESFRTRSESVS